MREREIKINLQINIATHCTHMKLRTTIAVHPAHHNVRLQLLSIRGDTKANPSIGANVHSEVYLLLLHVKIPMKLECAIVKVVGEGVLQVEVLHTSDQLH